MFLALKKLRKVIKYIYDQSKATEKCGIYRIDLCGVQYIEEMGCSINTSLKNMNELKSQHGHNTNIKWAC